MNEQENPIGITPAQPWPPLITVVLVWTPERRVGLSFPDEASERWANENADALRECMASFTNRYAWRTVKEGPGPASGPLTLTVSELLDHLRGILRAAFPETKLVIEEQTS